ncbi:hypothetical protein QQ045_021636 [Rhodiola kirilowii]
MDDKDQISEPMDPEIKLFGKSIQLPETSLGPSLASDTAAVGDDDVGEHRSCEMDSGLEDESADEGNLGDKVHEHELEKGNPQKANKQDATSGTRANMEKPIADGKTRILSSSGTQEEERDVTVSQEKTLKKPDKIIPCPRCASMDTKFCYFNNYNVNQPRYFCRQCQRYWTSGGTMRNLPVGAGRRKSKSSAVHYPQIAVHKDIQSASAPLSNVVVHRPVALNGSILSFVPDQRTDQLSSREIVEKPRQESTTNGSSNVVTEAAIVMDENASGSAGSVYNIEHEDEYKAKTQVAQSYQSFPPQMLCFPAPLWPPYPWNPAQYNHHLPSPINCRPGFPMPFYPVPMYMGCAVPGAWNMPWPAHSSSPNRQPDPKSQTLGKHSRDETVAKPSNDDDDEQRKEESPKPSIWVPKTLRIDDLEEAAKSSMLAKLGINNNNTVSASSKGHFKPFSSVTAETSCTVTPSSALLANPAALSRSMNFHESV